MKSFKLFMEEQQRTIQGEISAIKAVQEFLPHETVPQTEEEAKRKFDAEAKKEHEAYRKKVEEERRKRRRGRRNP